ncbi:hypothetical protein POTOM_041406 [Populus tomentosa]|uniref:non-specific serine/threonine protein kinase n=1 Tax=Populus tomentosa TaxID=118781 RepID=A0A8X7YLS7_POPTO|nr:hypothetical protein POTOM_041406 [Populus tomentosa]
MGDNHALEIADIGTIKLKMYDGLIRTISGVRHVKDLKKNLLSVGQFDSLGCKIRTHNGIMKIVKRALVVLKAIKTVANMFVLMRETHHGAEASIASANPAEEKTMMWHQKLGHMSEKVFLYHVIDKDDSPKVNTKSKAKKRIVVSTVLSTGILFIGLCLVLYVWKKKQQKNIMLTGKMTGNFQRRSNNKDLKEGLELPFFNMDELACATNNFSVSNKVGEGGFGPVYKVIIIYKQSCNLASEFSWYKLQAPVEFCGFEIIPQLGTLTDGREIAVKRLSKNSRQGLDEFKNEVKHIVKLQHRNLVRLLGCCIERDETVLVYEFLPNKSLDFFIFDETQSLLLDWPKRNNIINGIARGLLYLHQDSRLRIIHRDLKTSNILLDYGMNPKISDFGLARSFGENETEANTNKVAGTYGYISPEYANHGLYSLKSDVFSFGVLVLEIVSGNRNRGFCHPDHRLNLIGHAWILFKQGRALELAAESKVKTPYLSEVLRSIHVGLLCVQENPENRPNMSYVVLMLGNEDELPQPKQPGFFTERDLVEASCSSSQSKPPSANECSFSVLEAR